MNKDKHIPSGYKSSPLGPIPEDWEVRKLGEVCAFLRTNTLSRNQLNDVNGDIHNIHYGDVLVKYPSIIDVQKQSIPFINSEDYKESMIDFIEDGDIVLADTAEDETVGKACEIANIGSEKILSGLHTMLIRPQKGLFFPCFLGYQVNSVSYRKQLQALIQGIKVCSLGKQAIANTYFAVPPLPEQHRIVSVLSLWDTAIAKQTALIEKLSLRKRGLMQQLLTGKKRLKGFEGEWKEVRMGDVALVIGGGTPNTGIFDYWNGNIPWFTPSEIGENKYVNISERTISEKGLNDSSAKLLPKGTILFTSRATIGAKAILTTEATTNQGFQSLVVTDGNNNEFIYYYLDIILNEIKQKASGSTFPEVSAESIRKIKVVIPNLEEQTAIASVLVDADKEIELANEKSARLQEEKKGLMQVLLTGKRRVK